MGLDSFPVDFRRDPVASGREVCSHSQGKHTLGLSLKGDVGHTGLRRDAAQKTCLGEGPWETVSCYHWLKESCNWGSPWGAREEGKMCPFMGDTLTHQGGMGYCGVPWF